MNPQDKETPAVQRQLCSVRGLIRPGAMCGSIIVGMKECGFKGKCVAQEPMPPAVPWTMPVDKELFAFINSTPLVQSLLYDLNLLPECINDSTRWAYMVTVCHHLRAAINKDQQHG